MNKQKGVMLVWTALLLPVTLIFLALVIDISFQHIVKQDLKNAADASAHAYAIAILNQEPNPLEEAQSITNNYRIFGDHINQNSVQFQVGHWHLSDQSFKQEPPINAVQVTIAHQRRFFFQSITSVGSFQQEAKSIVLMQRSPKQVKFVE